MVINGGGSVQDSVDAAVVLRFIEFDLERGYDFFRVGYGDDASDDSTLIKSFTGMLKLRALSSNKDAALWMAIVTDRSGTRQGFDIELNSIEVSGKDLGPYSQTTFSAYH